MKAKQTTPNQPKGQHQGMDKKAQRRPEVRDDLDSRQSEEQREKGDDTTHNKKERKAPGRRQ